MSSSLGHRISVVAPTTNKRRRRCGRKHDGASNSRTPSSLGDKIPDELTREILLRVPAKSLLRFKAVSKPWRNLVANDPSFVHNHKLTRASSLSPRRYVITCDDERPSVLRLGADSNFDFVSMGGLPDAFRFHSRVVGYLDGLFCVFYRSVDVLIWNPATRETWPLPPSLNKRSNFHSCLTFLGCFSYGFGFDSSSGDYKVVRVLRMFEAHGNATYRVEVCNARAGSNWRELVPPSPLLSKCRHEVDALCHRGRCYFMTKRFEDSLLVFDLAEETFQLVPLPFACPWEDSTSRSYWYRVIELHGAVGLVSYVNSIKNPYCFDLWMMSRSPSSGDGAGQVSWSRYMTVETFSKNFTVLFVTEKCELLIRDHETGRLNLRDVRTGQVLDLRRRVRSRRVFAYTDSLVSVNGND